MVNYSRYTNDPALEAYRLLRANLEFVAKKNEARTVLITSTGPGAEGKSTISVNLAFAFAEIGKRVMLVDADLRKPRLHKILSINPDPGLSDILKGQTTPTEVTRKYLNPHEIEIVPCGTREKKSAPIIDRLSFTRLLKDLSNNRDLVIVDSPPLVISDSLSMAASVDGVILVVSIGESNKRGFRDGLKMLENAEANLLGIVANKIPHKQKEYYYSYY
ncbi:CpsD/CapB family tyrosine-protein kinase [Halothermothrix orenii]|uniref:Non-specific protein-tyrosine kinase n=1 Tax=Halothermothrix orenii (strain H 168 / OCM 544 / DSM 9562) TaxID=373903 RepID=B8D0N2_HALOH|nr:CpsD/CapB family tyrosine-protein kinase [Halothermothrix orenii]ACL70968.1 Non-specific protein-tyrosine kinase [Halothermothrix orenii H 168]